MLLHLAAFLTNASVELSTCPLYDAILCCNPRKTTRFDRMIFEARFLSSNRHLQVAEKAEGLEDGPMIFIRPGDDIRKYATVLFRLVQSK